MKIFAEALGPHTKPFSLVHEPFLSEKSKKVGNLQKIAAASPHRNIANIFNIPAILNELQEYDITNIEILPTRQLRKHLYAMYMICPYVGIVTNPHRDKYKARIALIVDYDRNTALAVSRSGADKATMILMSSIANKHIEEPFKLDKTIRNRL